jgi:hypothetical protein
MGDPDVTEPSDAPEAAPPLDPEEARRRALTSDDFLVPGPTPTSNEGLRRWGLSWLIFSIVLILLMLLMSYVCFVLAKLTGAA